MGHRSRLSPQPFLYRLRPRRMAELGLIKSQNHPAMPIVGIRPELLGKNPGRAGVVLEHALVVAEDRIAVADVAPDEIVGGRQVTGLFVGGQRLAVIAILEKDVSQTQVGELAGRAVETGAEGGDGVLLTSEQLVRNTQIGQRQRLGALLEQGNALGIAALTV